MSDLLKNLVSVKKKIPWQAWLCKIIKKQAWLGLSLEKVIYIMSYALAGNEGGFPNWHQVGLGGKTSVQIGLGLGLNMRFIGFIHPAKEVTPSSISGFFVYSHHRLT